MIVRLLLAILIIVAMILFIHWFRTHPAKQVSQALKKASLYALIALVIVLAISGRLHWLFALVASLLPFVKRALPLLRYIPIANLWYRHYQARRSVATGAAAGQTSQVETRFIRMTLDHDSGRIDGTILADPYNGRQLSQLSLQQLLECWQLWNRQDQESTRLLEAFLDQSQGPQWREQVDAGNGQVETDLDASMTEDEALAILGLQATASRDDIIQAHRLLMQRLHPDRGGSTYLAAKVNQAKDLLLDRSGDSV